MVSANISSKISPETPEEFARLFREATARGLKLSLRGLSTQGVVPPGRREVSTLKLNRAEFGGEGDMTLTAEAGLSWEKLRELTAGYHCRWDDYPGTIGGCLCGRKDTVTHQQLASRVLGMTIIRPTGEIVEIGSYAVKDVAGYRLTPLFFASQGRLGMVAKVVLNLAPIFREYSLKPQEKRSQNPDPQGMKIIEHLIKTLDPGGIFS